MTLVSENPAPSCIRQNMVHGHACRWNTHTYFLKKCKTFLSIFWHIEIYGCKLGIQLPQTTKTSREQTMAFHAQTPVYTSKPRLKTKKQTKSQLTKSCKATHSRHVFLLCSGNFGYRDLLWYCLLLLFYLTSSTFIKKKLTLMASFCTVIKLHNTESSALF